MFVAFIVVVLYFLPYFISQNSISDGLVIPAWGAILAGLNISVALLLYIFAPKDSRAFPVALGIYLLLVGTIGALLTTTGGLHSLLLSLWILTTVFASAFGLWALVPVGLAPVIYALWLATTGKPLDFSEVVVLVAAGFMPIIGSYIIFHSKRRVLASEDSSYHEPASELSQASTKADVVIYSIDEGVLSLNKKGNIELINPAAQQLIGWEDSDAIGLNYASVLKLVDGERRALTNANDPIAAALRTNRDGRSKAFSAVTSSNKYIQLSLSILPIEREGNAEGVIVVFRDITRELAEEHEQAEFISTASHEMRTPVASIEGYLGLALNPATATIDEKAREFLEKAHASAQHLGRLFQDLLDVNKADDGRLSNHPSVFDAVEFIGEISEGFQQNADQKGLRLIFAPAPNGSGQDQEPTRVVAPVFYINVDADHLRETVSNLIENAIKYSSSGDIIVDVTADNEHTIISVKDNGIGIAREDVPHLFQKFYRVDNSKTREIGGTGLGLYLCRRLAEVMGGRIWVDSEFGKGSTFYVELQRISTEEAHHKIDAAKAVSQSAQPERAIQQPTESTTSPTTSSQEAPVFHPLTLRSNIVAASTSVESTPDKAQPSRLTIPIRQNDQKK